MTRNQLVIYTCTESHMHSFLVVPLLKPYRPTKSVLAIVTKKKHLVYIYDGCGIIGLSFQQLSFLKEIV